MNQLDLFGEVKRDDPRKASAVFGGANREYRYELVRHYGAGTVCNFLMLNPSTADERDDDNTITRCIEFGLGWGHRSIFITNLFAFRSTDPAGLLTVDDPIGPRNDTFIVEHAEMADVVVCAWGQPGKHLARKRQVCALLNAVGVELHVLRLCKDGTPEHPLYLPGNLQPVEWRP